MSLRLETEAEAEAEVGRATAGSRVTRWWCSVRRSWILYVYTIDVLLESQCGYDLLACTSLGVVGWRLRLRLWTPWSSTLLVGNGSE